MGSAKRIVRGISSFGVGELNQEKPFQDIHKDRPTKGAGGPLSYIPGFGVATEAWGGLAGQATQSDLPVLSGSEKPELPVPGESEAERKAREEAERLAGEAKALKGQATHRSQRRVSALLGQRDILG